MSFVTAALLVGASVLILISFNVTLNGLTTHIYAVYLTNTKQTQHNVK